MALGKRYNWRQSDMYAAIVRKPGDVVTNFAILGSADPIPDELFQKLREREGQQLWCHYLVSNGKVERWNLYDPRSNSWREAEPPATFKLAIMVAK